MISQTEVEDTDVKPPSGRVLIVEDSPDSAMITSLRLKFNGHAVQVAHNAKEAFAKADAFNPQVVILDIGLPLISGLEVARTLRISHPNARILAVSGYGLPEDIQASLEAGCRQHLVKPVDPEKLCSLVQTLLTDT